MRANPCWGWGRLARRFTVWTAIGAARAVILGIVVLGDPATVLRITGIALVLGGVVRLRSRTGRSRPVAVRAIRTASVSVAAAVTASL